MDRPTALASFREEVERSRLRDWLATARRLSDVPPETTLMAALDLTDFLHKLSRVGG